MGDFTNGIRGNPRLKRPSKNPDTLENTDKIMEINEGLAFRENIRENLSIGSIKKGEVMRGNEENSPSLLFQNSFNLVCYLSSVLKSSHFF